MTISNRSWMDYIARLRRVNDAAADKMSTYLETHNVATDAGRQALLDYAYGISTQYGEAAAELACEMYDAAGALSGLTLPPAEPAEPAGYREVARAVTGTMKSGNAETVSGSVARLVKRTAADTTLQNARRDGAEFAWIPHGDTCAFCLAIASRGWQNVSAKTLKKGHAEHIHANCDCNYAVRFDESSGVAGYDPDALLEQYQAAEGATPQEKINSLRRAQYAERKDEINAQKRAAYAAKIQKKKALHDGEESSILSNRGAILLSKNAGDSIQPKSIQGDYQDFLPIDLSEEERKWLKDLNELAKNTSEEHGFAAYQGGRTQIQTNHDHNSVSIGIPADVQHVKAYHSHTDDSVISPADILNTVLRENVDREYVISQNGDVWILDYTNGIRPDRKTLEDGLIMCGKDASIALSDDPEYDNWSYEERYYMLGREKMLRVARLFEWGLMGGAING